jgi:MFS transporter, FHS family, glucose/mannose:H+ symporter
VITPSWRPSRRVLLVLVAAYWAYLVNGIVNSEIGPSLLGMVHSFHLSLADAGAIFSAQFIGYLPGALSGGMAVDRWGFRKVLIPATLLVALGTAGTPLVGSWSLVIVLTAVAGFGFGAGDSLCNAMVAAEVPGEGATALNLLHTFFGIGALLGPLLVGTLLASPGGWQAVFLISGALAGSCTILFALVPIPPPAHLGTPAARSTRSLAAISHVPRFDLRVWLIAGLLFLFVGMEQLVGGWVPTYLHRVLGADDDVAARSVSLYWAAVTVGRILAGMIALRLSNARIVGGSAVLALVALTALALVGGVNPALIALAGVGLGFAAIYPTIMAITAGAYPLRFATLAGFLVAAGGLGGLLFPWLGGVVGQTWGLRATMWLGTGLAAAMLLLFVVFLKVHRSAE